MLRTLLDPPVAFGAQRAGMMMIDDSRVEGRPTASAAVPQEGESSGIVDYTNGIARQASPAGPL